METAATNESERLDVRVARTMNLPSRSVAQTLISGGQVKVNGKVVDSSSKKVSSTDKITADISELYDDLPEIDLDVLYEDDDCVVINKPVGLLTHSKGAFNPEPTVASWLNSRLKAKNVSNRDGIVHRLDRATSGVMICAKTPEALSWLQKQFSVRKVKKTYVALIEGEMDPKEAIIDMPIERNPKKPQKFRVGPNGKPAITKYKTDTHIEIQHKTFSLLKLTPTTGRTHQLRVHLANLGHPIVGDTFYEGRPAERLYLHALSLELTLPSRKRMTFSAGLPDDFKEPSLKS